MFAKAFKVSKFRLSALFLICLISLATVACAQTQQQYGIGLTEYGSDKSAFTIYTNPGQDCSTTMNISWATPPGKSWLIELTDLATGAVFEYDYDESFQPWEVMDDSISNGKLYKFPYVYRCETFNDIPSKLSDGTSVNEKHIFDKHGYELFQLDPDREYSYRIITFDDETNDREYSEPYTFRTAGAPAWKAAVIGDFHHYSPSWKRLESAMGMIDVIDSVAGGIDWVLSTGDQTAWGGSYNFWTELSEQPNYMNHMWASVQGNHDNMTSTKKLSDNFFRDSHYFPQNGYEGQEGVSYWFKYGDVLFIMLNNEATRLTGGLQPAIEWMEKVVSENPSKYVVVVEHHQWIIGTNGASSALERLYKTFDKLGVDLAISGHNHVYLRTFPLKDKIPVSPEEGTYYVVNSSSDNQRGRDIKKLAANRDLIEKRWSEGAQTIGGMLMDVNPERIEMTLYDRNGVAKDTFTVPAKR